MDGWLFLGILLLALTLAAQTEGKSTKIVRYFNTREEIKRTQDTFAATTHAMRIEDG